MRKFVNKNIKQNHKTGALECFLAVCLSPKHTLHLGGSLNLSNVPNAKMQSPVNTAGGFSMGFFRLWMAPNSVGKITHTSNQHLPLLGNPSAQKGCGHVLVTCLLLHLSLTLCEESADHQNMMRQRSRSWPWNCLLNSDRLQHIPLRNDKERFIQAHICTWLGTIMSCS